VKLGIIGSGISGLSAALYLTRESGVSVEVFEKGRVAGGRANVTPEGEHCPRLFLTDYDRLFQALRQLSGPEGGSVYDELRPLKRFFFSETRGWIELSHLYGVLAREIPLRDRLRAALARSRPPLIAAEVGPNANVFGSRKNVSFRTILKLGRNLLKSRSALALKGPTDRFLIEPWVRHLKGQGVRFHLDTPVLSLAVDEDGVTIETPNGARRFDAVLVTAFLPDAVALLDASGIEHSLRQFDHIHCACFTIGLNEAEPILKREGPGIYCREGINILVQTSSDRCVALCTNSASTDRDWVVERVQALLELRYPIVDVKCRDNQALNEAVYWADYVKRDEIARGSLPRVHFAGTYIDNSYPLDSGEGAARSAWDAVQMIRQELDTGPDAAEPQLAEA
jgi:glycine/D-amino acid oxidase-like deaminating enzyme